MGIMPGAVWRPVSAHGGPIGAIYGVVEHVTAGEGDPFNEFANPNNQVSSHFGIGNGQGGMADGLIEQYVDTAYKSWAQAAGNTDYISVETEGQPTEALTAAQVASFGRIMSWVNAAYGVPLVVIDTPGQRGLITHGDGGAAWGGHYDCPGAIRKAQRSAILAATGGPPPPGPPATQKEPNMIAHDSVTGGYWVVRSNATIYAFAGAPYLGPLPKYTAAWGIGTASNPVVGVAPDGAGGYTLATDNGGSQPAIYHITPDGQYAK